METLDTQDLITISEAARQTGMARNSIYGAIEAGRLWSVTIGGKQFVSSSQVKSYVPRAYEGKRESKRQPGEKGPSRWDRAQV